MDSNFIKKLKSQDIAFIKGKVEVLQVNLGKRCNLACTHCHVNAGPGKVRENMSYETAKAVITMMDMFHVSTVDLTGGAPELNPHFRLLVSEAKKRGLHVIDRCNLCVLFETGQETLVDFLAKNRVEIVASLPCYLKENVDMQRGKGVFDKSIEALLLLNSIGYGQEGSGLFLNLVYNPLGAHLPPLQKELERDYARRLSQDFGIYFNTLYTITNMPIARYLHYLRKTDQYDGYIDLLVNNFNHQVLPDLMCKNTINVSWDGKLYDCDFNQMLGLHMGNGEPFSVFTVSTDSLKNVLIQTGTHCFGCTAGAGSSCGGALAIVEPDPLSEGEEGTISSTCGRGVKG